MIIGKLYGVGVGPGDPELLTLKAVRILKSADVIFYAIGRNSTESISGGIIDHIGIDDDKRSPLVFSMSRNSSERKDIVKKNAALIAEELKKGRNCIFATIGDPLIYSTFIYIMRDVVEMVPGVEVEIVPGVTSYQASAAKVLLPLCEDTEKLLVIPAFDESQCESYPVEDADTIIFLKTYRSRNKIIEFIKDKNISFSCLYASKTGLDEEIITENIDKIKKLPEEYLSMLIVKINK